MLKNLLKVSLISLMAVVAIPNEALARKSVKLPNCEKAKGNPWCDIDSGGGDGGSNPEPGIEAPTGIVYTRVPRTTGSHEVTLRDGTSYTLIHADNWDRLPEAGHVLTGFNAGGQLVFRDWNGTETVIHDCQGLICTPTDASVSLDGTKVIYSVYRSDTLKTISANRVEMPNKMLSDDGAEAQIYVHDLVTGERVAWPHTDGVHDISPIFLADGRVMFASTREGYQKPWLHKSNSQTDPQPRLYIANADGSNAVDVSPHELSGAIHPYLLKDGRVVYSSLWQNHNLPYYHNNSKLNHHTTVGNMWNLVSMDQTGGDMTTLLGAHRKHWMDQWGRRNTYKALHFAGQLQNGDVCVTNYYRGNNLGLGELWCFTPEAHGIEGAPPLFVPGNIYRASRWATSRDNLSKMSDGKYLGKLGWPEGLGDGRLMVASGRGHCTKVAQAIPGTPEQIEENGGPGCDVGLYGFVPPAESIDEMELIVDDPYWHEFAAREVRARDIPAPPTHQGDACTLVTTDAGRTDAHAYAPYKFNSKAMMMAAAGNGAEIHGLPHDELAALRFYELLPHTGEAGSSVMGTYVRELGDVQLLADKSAKVQLPCNTPFITVGLDRQGRVIKREQAPQSLRPGETRVCDGCHQHSEPGRKYSDSMAYHAQAVLLLESTPVPTWTNDIQPMLETQCGECHDWTGKWDYDSLVWDYKTAQVQRPMTSKYVSSMFARESLLYWKAAGERTDGRTDEQYEGDIDYGPAHPDTLRDDELALLARWIDAGAER